MRDPSLFPSFRAPYGPDDGVIAARLLKTAALSAEDRHQLMFRADKALYLAKDSGRNRTRLWSERTRARALRN